MDDLDGADVSSDRDEEDLSLSLSLSSGPLGGREGAAWASGFSF